MRFVTGKFAVALIFLGAAGCGDHSPLPSLFPGRLDISSDLRTLCRFDSDDEIAYGIATIENVRLAGATKAAALSAAGQACDSDSCLTCTVAIINQVYGP